ncbi:MAG TPA: phospholipase D-like domain-containing protein, partial [Polyangia bacterium]|nr:phospholipase D-like domain-containing protein [Polyangia bacterium]
MPKAPTFVSFALAVAAGCTVTPTAPPRAAPAAIHLMVEPDAGGDAVVALILGARRSLTMEMYLLTDGASIDALVDRKRAGVDVRVALEPHPFGADGANQDAFERLAAAGVAVSWTSPRFALTHAKVFVVDGATLVVQTLNLTRAGLATNREYVVVDEDARDVAAAAALVTGDLAGAPPTAPAASRLVASPTTARGAL